MFFDDPFSAMQAAVDIVGDSTHPSNKIAATLYGKNFGLSRTNYWPKPISDAFGHDQKIGNSSGTLHAETACILEAEHAVAGASLCITDPFCPNCAKNIAEAGIKKIYIDHKGFEKDFFQRRAGHFDAMSMQICEKAGVSVYELWRQDERLVPIYEAPPAKFISEDSPIFKEPIQSINDGVFKDILANAFKVHKKRKFSLVLAQDKSGNFVSLTARGHAVMGFTMDDPDDIAVIQQGSEKYSFFQEPVNRVLMYMARHGLKPVDGYFFCSQIPTSREQVNLVGAGIKGIVVGDITKSRDKDAMDAMRQLSAARVLTYL